MLNAPPFQFARRVPVTEAEIDARLKWLAEALAVEEHRRRLFRSASEEEQAGLMRRPLTTPEAYAKFGALLGALPPAAISYRLFGYGMYPAAMNEPDWWPFLFLLCFAMNSACGLIGHRLGSFVGQHIDEVERVSWNRMLLTTVLMGVLWGTATGGAGGVIFFGVGSFFGIICAAPVGALAFPALTLLHRPLARGGMIGAAHFWPLAWGITLSVTAFVLGL